jgi:phytol kinase
MLSNNFLALVITFAVALAWLRLNDFAAQRGWISSDLSRKIIHIGTGPLYVLCWLLFPDVVSARYYAMLVPLAITAQFVLVGSGLIKDEAAVKAMSRSGDRREILQGPLYYGLAFIILTLVYWKTSPVGIVALMLMCGGDGLADIVGRRVGVKRLPWNKNKSWVGSVAMFLGGLIAALLVLAVFLVFHVFPGSLGSYLPALTAITLSATLVESLPLQNIDNITITLTAMIIGAILF